MADSDGSDPKALVQSSSMLAPAGTLSAVPSLALPKSAYAIPVPIAAKSTVVAPFVPLKNATAIATPIAATPFVPGVTARATEPATHQPLDLGALAGRFGELDLDAITGGNQRFFAKQAARLGMPEPLTSRKSSQPCCDAQKLARFGPTAVIDGPVLRHEPRGLRGVQLISHPSVAPGLPAPRQARPIFTPDVGPAFRGLPWWERQTVMSRPLGSYDVLPLWAPIPAGTGQGGDTMRLVGAWIYPQNAVVTAYGSWASTFCAVWTRSISTSRATGTFGRALAPATLVSTGGPATRGFSAASIRNDDGSAVDAAFVWVDPSGLGRVWMFSVDGRTGLPSRPSAIAQGHVTSASTRRITSANPVVCSGRFGGRTSVLIAFAVTLSFTDGRPDEFVIETGRLENISGRWAYVSRSEVPAYPDVARGFPPPWNLAAAFDSNVGACVLRATG